MTTNQELAEIFRAIADVLDLEGVRFKPEAYRRAARSLESLAEDVRRVHQRGELGRIPGVGDALAEKIREYLSDGRIAYFERVQREVPPGVLELMRLPGVGPKTARRFLVEFGIQGPKELQAALDAGTFVGVKGFGSRKVALLREAVGVGGTERRRPLVDGWRIAEELRAALAARAPVDRVEAAGSLRRCRESVGDLDLLVTSRDPARVLAAFGTLPAVRSVKLSGTTKETVELHDGLQVDLRVVAPDAFGAALQYFTGSKDHNVHLRTLARDAGLKVNEYGVFRDEEKVAGATEEGVYAALRLPWIPPEMREDRGEIEAALAGTLPPVVASSDLVGELHVHLPERATPADVDRRLEEAARRGWSFVGFIPPATGSLGADLVAHLRSRRRGGSDRAGALLGSEVPLEAATAPDGADYVLGSARGRDRPPEPPLAIRPVAVVHLGAGAPGAAPAPDATRAWVDWARDRGVGLEVGPLGSADGLDSAGVRRAQEAQVPVHLTAAAGVVADGFGGIDLAVGLARRGWLSPDRILNRAEPAPPARAAPPRRPPTGRRAPPRSPRSADATRTSDT